MTLDEDDIEAIAARVLELMREQNEHRPRLIDAATLAHTLGVERDWVYARASRLGALRLGDGPRAPLRFDVQRVRELLAQPGQRTARPADPSPGRQPRARARRLPPGVKPVRARPSR